MTADSKETAEKAAPTAAKQTEAPKDASPTVAPWVWPLIIAALAASLLQQAVVDDGSKSAVTADAGQFAQVGQWAKGLIGPHEVPPPKATKNEVVIQFCQS
eukprot:TRINITY_DN103039_c0_g1_i1.p3 TRINITY_DN103039_c0_g1~~TRINITY_DN103039_c0_g1_i1.p3  ORF type:complete len:101 (+),score=31.83 TRINITY_DN103039_c0_g1_i1:114-416(+)